MLWIERLVLTLFLPVLVFVALALVGYSLIDRQPKPGEGVGLLLALFAVRLLLDGGTMLIEQSRRHEDRQWSGIGMVASGVTLGVAALAVSGRLRRRRKWVTSPAVVISVEPVAQGTAAWRVVFAYFANDGNAHESVDEVYVDGVKPGDPCTAVYPVGRPDVGTLRLQSSTS